MPQQFVGTAIVTGGITAFVLKSMVVAVPLAFASGYVGNWIGQWQGDYKGYRRAVTDMKKETEELNARIATLNEELDARHRSAEAESVERSQAIGRSLAEISPEQRKQCAAGCGLPKSVKQQIGEIQ
jgi:septal ring factor EnvC (AmiA/AmiB activator)